MIKRYRQGKYLHRAVEANGVIYVCGLTSPDKTLDIRGQTEQVLAKLEESLHDVGSDKAHVVAVSVYLTDMAHKDGLNEAWTAFFAPDELPARSTMGVKDLGPGALIEIMATAVRR